MDVFLHLLLECWCNTLENILASVVTKTLDVETEARTEASGFETEAEAKEVASETEAKAEAVYLETEAEAQQAVGLYF